MSSAKIHPATEELLEDARLLEWSVYDHGSGRRQNKGWRLVSPLNSSVTIDVPPVRQWNDGKLRTLQERLIRYSDPKKVQDLFALRERKRRLDEAVKKREQREAQRALEEAQRAAQDRAEGIVDAEVVEDDTPPEPSQPGTEVEVHSRRPNLVYAKEPTVLDQRPWFARHGKREGVTLGYPSHSVDERHWSDGTVDFVCRACGWVADNPKSVTVHWSRTKDEQHPRRTTNPDVMPLTDYVAYTPVLPRNYGGSGEPTTELVPVPLAEDSAVLDQIRALVTPGLIAQIDELEQALLQSVAEVDRLNEVIGEHKSLLAAATQRAESADAKLAEVEKSLDEITHDRDRLLGERRALAEMLQTS